MADFCIVEGKHFFVRGTLPWRLLSLLGNSFAYGVCSSPSEKSFDLHVAGFDSGVEADDGPSGNRTAGGHHHPAATLRR